MKRTPKTIFIADDDPVLLRGLDLALTGRGYAVRTASDGLALLSLLERERPDLLVMDVAMPGLTGLEVLRRLRSDGRWRHLPVVVVTGRADPTVRDEAAAGGAAVVLKPFGLAELLSRIEMRLA